jgi:hypothetical protein
MNRASQDTFLRAALALSAEDQIAALLAMTGHTPTPVPPTTPAEPAPKQGVFKPIGGSLTVSPAGGSSWKPYRWPKTAIVTSGSELVPVCVDHDYLKAHCPRSRAAIAKQKARIDRWLPIRGIFTMRGYGVACRWTPATVVTIVTDAIRAVPSLPHDVSPDIDEAVTWVSVHGPHDRRPSGVRVMVPLIDDDDGCLELTVAFADDATAPLRELHARWPYLGWSLSRARDSFAQPNAPDTENEDDDDGEDLASRMLLATVRKYICPQATWPDIRSSVAIMRSICELAHGRREGEQ